MIEDVVFYSEIDLDENKEVKTEKWVMLIDSKGFSHSIPVKDLNIDSHGAIEDYKLAEEAENKLRRKLHYC